MSEKDTPSQMAFDIVDAIRLAVASGRLSGSGAEAVRLNAAIRIDKIVEKILTLTSQNRAKPVAKKKTSKKRKVSKKKTPRKKTS